MEKLGVRLKTDLSPKNAPHTNTVIDFRKIDRKNAAYLIAKALFEGMISGKFGDYQNTKESDYIDQFEVDFNHIPWWFRPAALPELRAESRSVSSGYRN